MLAKDEILSIALSTCFFCFEKKLLLVVSSRWNLALCVKEKRAGICWFGVFRLSEDREYRAVVKESPRRAGRDRDYSWKFEPTNSF